MGTYKTTEQDFQIFQEAVAFWQRKLGMLSWQLYTRHTFMKDQQGYSVVNLSARCATLTLSTTLSNYDEPPGDRIIRRIAFHEVCEVLMARMMICAEARYVQRDELEEARHEVIRTLESVIFEAGNYGPVAQ